MVDFTNLIAWFKPPTGGNFIKGVSLHGHVSHYLYACFGFVLFG